MTCHSQLYTQTAMLAPVRESSPTTGRSALIAYAQVMKEI